MLADKPELEPTAETMTLAPTDEPAPAAAGSVVDRIFAGALVAFRTKGYETISMDTIARLANVSKATIYNNFESKEAVVRDLLRLEAGRFVERVVNGAAPRAADPKLALEALARSFLREACQPDTMGMYRLTVSESTRFPWIGEIFSRYGILEIIRHFAELIEGTGKADPKKCGEQLYSLLMGYYYLRRVLGVIADEGHKEADSVVREALETLGLRPTP